MHYTKNLGLKLRAQDFEFSYSYESTEENLNYEVFKKDAIHVTLCHIQKKAIISIENDDHIDDIKSIRSLGELKMLHRLIYGVQKQSINNEEGD